MRYPFIEEHHKTWPVRVMCRVLLVTAAGFYKWRQQRRLGPSRREVNRLQLLEQIRDLHQRSSGRYGAPTGLLCSEALASGGSDLVEARPALVFGSHPSRFDPAGLFHAMEGGIERTFFDAQDVLGHGLNPGGDAVAVKRSTPGKNLQREEGERALQGILTGHT